VRLLLVEDNAMNVELFTAALETDGHEVVVERDGRSGLARALAERFDLVILDVQLPGMDGVAVVRELRAADRRGPIVAVSSSAMADQVKRGLEAGFDAYLTKPISPAELRAAVRRYTAS
jgi:DNA-binding response OmpR family regulator